MLPYTKTKAQKSLWLDDFSGGVNLADGEAQVRDDQLTACDNLWNNGGHLHIRPGIAALQQASEVPEGERISVRIFDDVFLNDHNKRYVPRVTLRDHDVTHAEFEGEYAPQMSFRLIDTDTGEALSPEPYTVSDTYAYDVAYFLFAFGDALYCFLNYCHVMDGRQYKIIKVTTAGTEEIDDESIYVPLVITGGKPVPYLDSYAFNRQNLSRRVCKGIGTEGFNLLGSFYRAEYSAYAAESAQQVETDQGTLFRCAMEYPLPKEPCVYGSVTAQIKDINGNTYTHSLTVSDHNACSVEAQAGSDGLTMYYDKRMNTVYFCGGTSTTPNFEYNTNFLENNLLLTVQYENDFTSPDRERVFGMKRAAWFGGGGLCGGSRLFLGGNSGDDRAVILWSDLNNPLYFSENNYSFVGDRNQRVTAFGRQGEALVVFKEREIYQLRYDPAEEISAQSWIESGRSDLTAYAAYFPITQLHASVGCDLPDTVALCRNRLVWADSNGSVYTLVTQNQYSELGVWDISRQVRPALRSAELKKALALDWEEHYCLIAGNRVFVMDYGTPAFEQVALAAEQRPSERIPWFVWTLPLQVETARTDRDHVECVFRQGTVLYDGEWSSLHAEDQILTKRVPIEAFLQTKLFAFAVPSRTDEIVFSGSDAGGEPLTVQLYALGATQQFTVHPGIDADERDHRFRAVLRPGGVRGDRFRIKISGRGSFSLERMQIRYTPAL